MSDSKKMKNNKIMIRSRLRYLLLALLVLLPFGLYWAVQPGAVQLAWVLAAGVVSSMAVLIWLG